MSVGYVLIDLDYYDELIASRVEVCNLCFDRGKTFQPSLTEEKRFNRVRPRRISTDKKRVDFVRPRKNVSTEFDRGVVLTGKNFEQEKKHFDCV